MQVQVPLAVNMTDEQAEAYAAEYKLVPGDGSPAPRAGDIVDHVQALALNTVRALPAFEVDSTGIPGADVAIKRR